MKWNPQVKETSQSCFTLFRIHQVAGFHFYVDQKENNRQSPIVMNHIEFGKMSASVRFETESKIGPLSVLQHSITNNTQIMINCRNNKKLLGRVKCFDRHMNLVLVDVHEMWTEEPRKGKGKQPKKPVYKERFIQKMFLRGDSIMLVLKNPKGTTSPY